ncbi:hypothetical protein CAEBREN_21411 [Caenorhabditis brenneri]|uniref:Peptidase M13 N-terminal domain-containing protein n=1 Tax=Caenorhabditis brenneri TaxID=135651 RepID=G0NQI1_CAEBE|nr:hypothetical protein CAEBREN_21411 [Caenorhabditis brenneri]
MGFCLREGLPKCENYPIARNLIPQSPVLVFRNPQAEHHPFKSFCTWCCCIFCGFIFFLILISLGAKKDLDRDKLTLAYEGKEYESRHFPRPLPVGTRNFSTSSGRSTVVPDARNTVKPTVLKNETIPELTKNTCSTSTCKNLAGAMKSLIKESTPPCQDFYEHACGNTQGFQNYLNKIQIDNFHEKFKESFKEIANFLEHSPKELMMPSEKNLKKVYQKCLNRGNRDVEDLMKTLTEEFKWPFHEKEKYKRNIHVVNDILSKLIKLNPKALQLFEVVGKDKQLIIRPSFCHGKHDPIDTNALQIIFNIISKNPESDVRKLLENSLHVALEVDKAREYCTEISPPIHHKKEFNVDFDRSHIDFIRIFQLENISPEEVLSHLNFTDYFEIFQKDVSPKAF